MEHLCPNCGTPTDAKYYCTPCRNELKKPRFNLRRSEPQPDPNLRNLR